MAMVVRARLVLIRAREVVARGVRVWARAVPAPVTGIVRVTLAVMVVLRNP